MKQEKIAFDVLPADSTVLDVFTGMLGVHREDAARTVYLAGLKALEGFNLWQLMEARYSGAGESIDRQLAANEARSSYAFDGDIRPVLDVLYTFNEDYLTRMQALGMVP